MIKALRITDPTTTCIPWWDKVPFLKDLSEIEFTPGLNILWGPNGSGKSSVLKCLAQMLHCEQSGEQVVTGSSRRTLFYPPNASPIRIPSGATIDHDGQPIMHFDPGHAVGLVGGMAGFDGDFTRKGMVNALFKGSAGQQTLMRAGDAMASLVGKREIPSVQWRVRQPDLGRTVSHPRDKERLDQDRWIVSTLQGNQKVPETPRSTILFDEPERSLSIPLQCVFWYHLPGRALDRQIIVATHSPFAVDVPGANYIEFTPEYLEECRHATSMMWSRPFSDAGGEE